MSKIPSVDEIDRFIADLIAEDSADHDITSISVFDNNIKCNAVIESRDHGVLCGIDFAEMVFRQIDSTIVISKVIEDGTEIFEGDVVLDLKGNVNTILAGERIALNLLQHLSGISTLTAQFVESIKSTDAVIMDTRKTIPGLRKIQKYAVKMGGGHNHRMNLADGVLIKDNHIKFSEINGLSISDVVNKARSKVGKSVKIEIEVDDLDQFRKVIDVRPDIILLDNMDVETIKSST